MKIFIYALPIILCMSTTHSMEEKALTKKVRFNEEPLSNSAPLNIGTSHGEKPFEEQVKELTAKEPTLLQRSLAIQTTLDIENRYETLAKEISDLKTFDSEKFNICLTQFLKKYLTFNWKKFELAYQKIQNKKILKDQQELGRNRSLLMQQRQTLQETPDYTPLDLVLWLFTFGLYPGREIQYLNESIKDIDEQLQLIKKNNTENNLHTIAMNEDTRAQWEKGLTFLDYSMRGNPTNSCNEPGEESSAKLPKKTFFKALGGIISNFWKFDEGLPQALYYAKARKPMILTTETSTKENAVETSFEEEVLIL